MKESHEQLVFEQKKHGFSLSDTDNEITVELTSSLSVSIASWWWSSPLPTIFFKLKFFSISVFPSLGLVRQQILPFRHPDFHPSIKPIFQSCEGNTFGFSLPSETELSTFLLFTFTRQTALSSISPGTPQHQDYIIWHPSKLTTTYHTHNPSKE